jgi:hypothetical protein
MFTCSRRWWWRFKEKEEPQSRKGKGSFGIWEEMPIQENRKKSTKQREEE